MRDGTRAGTRYRVPRSHRHFIGPRRAQQHKSLKRLIGEEICAGNNSSWPVSYGGRLEVLGNTVLRFCVDDIWHECSTLRSEYLRFERHDHSGNMEFLWVL